MRLAFSERRLRIPRHDGLRRDIASIRLDWTELGQPRLVIDRREGSHADRAMALALAVAGTFTCAPRAEVTGAGIPRVSATVDAFLGGL